LPLLSSQEIFSLQQVFELRAYYCTIITSKTKDLKELNLMYRYEYN